MIGPSRAAVTSLFAEFKRQRLIEVRGAALMISKKSSLQRILEI
jgi:hypothetical protein